MSAEKGFVQKALNAFRQGSSPTDASAEGSPNRKPIDLTRVLQEAEDLWEKGHKISALEVLRKARLDSGTSNSELQFYYGKWAFEQKHFWGAREALRDAVDLDPTNLDALEYFMQADKIHPSAPGSLTTVFTRLAKTLPKESGYDSEAASFLLPSVRAVDIVDKSIRALKNSEDPVAREIAYLAFEPGHDWEDKAETATVEQLKAMIIIALSRGDNVVAFKLLRDADLEVKPKRAIRLAIHKEIRQKNDLDARVLLKHYRRLDPDDVWSRRELARVSKAGKFMSHYQLATRGFPFPKKKSELAYEPDTKKILYLLHNSLPHHSAGYATRTHGLLRGIRSHGWDVHGVTRLGYPYDMPKMESLGDIEKTIEVDGVPYHRLSTSEGIEMKNPIQSYVARYSKALTKLAKEQRPFVLHAASNHWNGLTAVTTANKLGIPSIYEVRGLWEVTRGSRDPEWMGGGMYRYMARMEADAAANATRVITITNALREELISRGVDGEKITVVPNGVESTRFTPRERNAELAERLGLQGKTVIGYIGSILDYEGLGLLLDAANELKKTRNDFAFLFVGDGAELALYRERVEKEGLSDVVTFTGRVPHHEVEDYYSLVDICPFPRLPLPVCEMVSPLKPFEAMAMEKAVIASDVAALAEIVTHGENGLLFEKGNVASLTTGLETFLNDPALREKLAKQSRTWVENRRDWNQLSTRISEIYEALNQ